MSKLKKNTGTTPNSSKNKEKLYKQVVHKNASKKIGIKLFFEETQAEIKKVKWPDYDLVIRASIFILVIVLLVINFLRSMV